MRSYILAIAIAMFLSALFAFQNHGDVAVRFLVFEWILPQGVWDVLLFAGGAVLMWIFSLFSNMETRGKYKKIIKVKDEKIAAIEKEKMSLLESFTASRHHYAEDSVAPAPAIKEEYASDEATESGTAY